MTIERNEIFIWLYETYQISYKYLSIEYFRAWLFWRKKIISIWHSWSVCNWVGSQNRVYLNFKSYLTLWLLSELSSFLVFLFFFASLFFLGLNLIEFLLCKSWYLLQEIKYVIVIFEITKQNRTKIRMNI